ncbi:MAG: TonB-dependent receptor [Ignavibacteria bacterium]
MFIRILNFSLTLILTILIFSEKNSAQTTGSIYGTVVDAKDNSPLAGALIKIAGSNKGANADDDGAYLILNVDVGTYEIEASSIDYETKRVKEVRVSVDSRVTLNFALSPKGAIETEIIVIEGTRSGIEKTEVGRLVTQEQIENSGIRGIQNIASKTAGVVTDERGQNINIRGGRSSENLIIVDGVVTSNPIDGSSNAFVPNSLVSELAVLTGGFGAEYGNALSGVINVTTKSGTERYSGSVEAITDEFNGGWLNTKSQGYNLYNLTFGGPLIPTKSLSRIINFYGAIERQNLKVTNPSWIADKLFSDGTIPHSGTQLWSYSGRLNFNFSELENSKIPIDLKFGALVSDNHQRNFIQSWLKTNSARNPLQLIRDNQYYGRLIHNVSNKFFYELQANYYKTTDETGDAFFLGNWFAYGDTSSNPALLAIQRSTGNLLQGTLLSTDPSTGNVFPLSGRVFNRYTKKEIDYLGGKLDAYLGILSKKYGEHEVKFGGEYRYHTLQKIDFFPAAIANNPIDPSTGRTQLNPQNLWFGRDVLLNSYGYDIKDQYGNQIVSNDDMEAKHPVVAAAYLRDKIIFSDFTVNAGLRMDYLDVATDVLIDPKNIIGADGELLSNDDYKSSEASITFSPRLGFSFPVTDKTVFVAQYGRFIQIPPLDFLYINKLAFRYFFSNSVQNVAENSSLRPEKLTSYEVGFKQEVSSTIDFGLSAYYKETRDQIGVTKVRGSATVPSGFALYANSDFSISRGLDFYLNIRRTNRVALDFAYSLLFASGLGSDPNSKFTLAQNAESELPRFAFPLDYDQRHTGSLNVDYRFGSTDVPKGFIGGVLSNMGLNVLFSFNSGRPYTTRQLPRLPFGDDGSALSTKNQVYINWNLRLDAKLDKSLKLFKTDINFYIYALNIFNTELINTVYGSTGLPGDNGYLNTPTGNAASSTYKDNFNMRIKTAANWGPPRQIRFGVKLSF